MDLYKLFASAATTTQAAASLDISVDGHITGACIDTSVLGANALDDGCTVEVSFASTSGFGSNDTKSSMLTSRVHQGFLTTGGGPTSKFVTVSGLAIAVAAGERVYLHIEVSGTCTAYASAYLYVMPLAGSPARVAERRR